MEEYLDMAMKRVNIIYIRAYKLRSKDICPEEETSFVRRNVVNPSAVYVAYPPKPKSYM
jgi:hypothetical protein